MPDAAQAVAEWWRVLRPGGEAVVVLNDAGHVAELRDAVDRAVGERGAWEAVLTHEAVPMLEAVFDDTVVHTQVRRLLITDAEPIAAFVASLAPLHRRERPWPEVVDDVRVWAQGEIDGRGHVEVHSRVSTLVAR